MSEDRTAYNRDQSPPHRDRIGAYITGLTLFLFAVMLVSGMLLSVYYVPSASPAKTGDGRALGAAVTTKPLKQGSGSGDVVFVVPLNATGDSIDVHPDLRGSMAPLIDSTSGRIIHPNEAWLSVDRTIANNVELGHVVRSIHHYASSLFIAALLLQLGSVVARMQRRQPSVGAWMLRGGLLVIALTAAFTGSILPWHRLALTAAVIGNATVREGLPFIGDSIASLMFGGSGATQATLTRMHAVHVAILPVIMSLVLVAVLRFARIESSSPDAPARLTNQHSDARRSVRLVIAAVGISIALLVIAGISNGSLAPDSLPASFGFVALCAAVAAWLSRLASPSTDRHSTTRDAIAWVLMGGVLLTTALVEPWRAGVAFNIPVDLAAANTTPADARPEWYLMFAYGAVAWLPGSLATVAILAVFLLLLSAPLIGRRSTTGRPAQTAAIVAVALLLVLTAIGYVG